MKKCLVVFNISLILLSCNNQENIVVKQIEILENKNFNLSNKDLLQEAKRYMAIKKFYNAKEILDTIASRNRSEGEATETNLLITDA